MEQSNCCGSSEWMETGLCSQCKEHADFQYWEEAEHRMNIIGQNGNDGLHYKTFNDRVIEFWENVKVLKR